MTYQAPIVVPYRVAAPFSWARAMLKPLAHALRRIVPAQAHAQRDVAALDREFNVSSVTENGWRVELKLAGPDLVLSLRPPELCVASDGLDVTLDADIDDIAAGPLEKAA